MPLVHNSDSHEVSSVSESIKLTYFDSSTSLSVELGTISITAF